MRAAILVFAFMLPYFTFNAPWKFLPSTIIMVFMGTWIWKNEFLVKTGIFSLNKSKVSAFTLFIVSALLINWFFSSNSIKWGITSGAHSLNPLWKFSPLLQSLNEEILIRAILCGILLKNIKNKFLLNFISTLIFVLLHWLLYQVIEPQKNLEISTLLTLGFFNMTANKLFFISGNMLYSWALHGAWNLSKFGLAWQWVGSGKFLTEVEGFNLIEGDSLVCILSALMCVLVYQIKKSSHSQQEVSSF